MSCTHKKCRREIPVAVKAPCRYPKEVPLPKIKLEPWQNIFDGGSGSWLWFRPLPHIGPTAWMVVEIDDFYDAIGERECKRDKVPRYQGEVYFIDTAWPSKADALKSCGYDQKTIDENGPDLIVEAMHSYGAKSPLGGLNAKYNGEDSWKRLSRDLLRKGDKIARDKELFESLMERVVNGVGQTALEFGRGDDWRKPVVNAVLEGTASPDQMLMAKMAGVDVVAVEIERKYRPAYHDDLLAFVFGYMGGANGGLLEKDPEGDMLAEAYVLGHELGTRVHKGEIKQPTWLKVEMGKPTQSLAGELEKTDGG